MSRATAFEAIPGLVQVTRDDVTTGEFDFSAPQMGTDAVEGLYGIKGYVKLGQVGVPVERSATGLRRVNFHVFGVTEGAPLLPDATPNATGDGRAETLLPPGSIAVIDSASLAELAGRASMSRRRLGSYVASLTEAQISGANVPTVTAAHAIPHTQVQSVTVGRGKESSFSSLLDREEQSLASRSHFTAAVSGLRYAASLRVHASNETRVSYMR